METVLDDESEVRAGLFNYFILWKLTNIIFFFWEYAVSSDVLYDASGKNFKHCVCCAQL